MFLKRERPESDDLEIQKYLEVKEKILRINFIFLKEDPFVI